MADEEGKSVVNYDEELAKMAKAATKVERPETSNIGTKAGVLTYNGDPIPGNKLDCIIIASTHVNLYYEDKYDPNDPKNPVCFAYCEDPDEDVMAPHPASSKPQAETCADCWANRWNSDPEGGRGKACKNSRRLALIPASTTPEDIPSAEVAALNLPVTSGKGWGTYVNKIAQLFARPPLGLITQIGTVPDVKSQFKITFVNQALVGNEMLPGLFEKAKLARPMLEKVYDPNPEETEEDKAAKEEKKAKATARSKRF